MARLTLKGKKARCNLPLSFVMKNIKVSYEVSIYLSNGNRIVLDGFFSTIDEAKEMWEVTRKQLEEMGYIRIGDSKIYYIPTVSITYVAIKHSTVNPVKGPSDEEALKILEDEVL